MVVERVVCTTLHCLLQQEAQDCINRRKATRQTCNTRTPPPIVWGERWPLDAVDPLPVTIPVTHWLPHVGGPLPVTSPATFWPVRPSSAMAPSLYSGCSGRPAFFALVLHAADVQCGLFWCKRLLKSLPVQALVHARGHSAVFGAAQFLGGCWPPPLCVGAQHPAASVGGQRVR